MSHYPPPGAPDSTPPPPPGGPSYAAHPTYGAQPSYGPPAGPPAWGPPVHQPGVVPLRPLTLGDIFGGALQVIRRNPKATVGMALLVSFGFMLLPILGTVVLGAGDLLPAVDVMDDSTSTSMGTTDLGFLVSTMISGVFSGLSTLVITGLIVRVVEQAVVGRRITAGEAWAASKGRLLPLLGLTLLVASGMLLVIGLPVGAAVAVGLAVGDTVLTVVLVVLASLLALVLTFFVYVRYVLLAAPRWCSRAPACSPPSPGPPSSPAGSSGGSSGSTSSPTWPPRSSAR